MRDAAFPLQARDGVLVHYSDRPAPNPSRWLFRFAIFLAVATVLLLFAGAMVTSTEAGLSVPDWPTTYGHNMFTFPYSKWVGGIFYEHSHRLIASSVGFLTIILAVWIAATDRRRWLRRLGGIALLAVIAQGILGGLTVKYLLPVPVSVGHAGLAQLFFCTIVSIAVFLSPSWASAKPLELACGATRLRALCVLTTVVIYVQILLGAVMRHTESGLAIPDFPLSYGRLVPGLDAASMAAINIERRWGEVWLPQVTAQQVLIHYLHRVGAVIASILIITTLVSVLRGCRRRGWLVRPAVIMAAILPIQIALGALTIFTLRDKIPNSVHVVVGALLLASSVVLTLRVGRMVRSADSVDVPAVNTAGAAV